MTTLPETVQTSHTSSTAVILLSPFSENILDGSPFVLTATFPTASAAEADPAKAIIAMQQARCSINRISSYSYP